MFPDVTASSLVPGWNSPNCGLCVQLTDQASGNIMHPNTNEFFALFGMSPRGGGQQKPKEKRKCNLGNKLRHSVASIAGEGRLFLLSFP
jgi:hypothetical protein